MIGKTISHYKIIEKIGEGGMGIVYKALDLKLDRFVALKFLPAHMGKDETQKQRFINEAKAVSAFDHPNICTIFEINETEDVSSDSSSGRIFIAMAYYDGQTLEEKITAEKPMPIDETIGIIIQIAQGLQRAHEKDIVHRDIKPANIIVPNEAEVKIVDFGLAKLKGQPKLTKQESTLGTILYMSPEQAEGAEMDARTDIWSLGVIFYEMLTGESPFSADYEQAVIYNVINAKPEPLTKLNNEVPTELEQVIQKCLEKDRDNRFQTVKEFISELDQVINQYKYRISLRSGDYHPAENIEEHKKVKPVLPITAAFIAICLIVAAIIFWPRSSYTVYEEAYFSRYYEESREASKDERTPDNIKANRYYLLSTAASNQNTLSSDVKQEYRDLLMQNPDSPQANYYLGLIYFLSPEKRSERDSVWILYDRAENLGLNSIYLKIDLLIYYVDWGNNQQALEIANKILQSYPEHPEALYEVGYLYYISADSSLSREYFQRSLNLYSDHIAPIIDLHRQALKTDDLATANKYIDRALAINNEYIRVVRYKTSLLEREGKPEEAEEYLKNIINGFGKSDVRFYKYLAQLYQKQDLFEPCDKLIALASNKFPDDKYFPQLKNKLTKRVEWLQIQEQHKSDKKMVQWSEDFEESMEEAQREKKPVFIEFYSTKELWSRDLERDIYPDPQIQNLLKSYIPLRINGELEINLAKKYGANYYPALVVLNEIGDQLTAIRYFFPGPSTDIVITDLEKGLVLHKKYVEGKTVRDQHITEVSNIHDALLLSKTKNLPVMAVILSKESEWSQKLVNETFTSPLLQSELRNVIRVNIDPAVNKSLVKKWNINYFPSIIFLNENGEKMHLVQGYQPPKLLAALIADLNSAMALQQDFKDRISWFYDLEEAKFFASVQKKEIFTFVNADWCPYCRWMIRFTFSNPLVIKTLNEKFVPLELHDVRDAESLKSIGVSGFPTFLVLDSKQTEILRLTGTKTAPKLLAALDLEERKPIYSILGREKYQEFYKYELLADQFLYYDFYLSAIHASQNQITIYPEYRQSYLNIAEAYRQLGNTDKMLSYYSLALEKGAEINNSFAENVLSAYLQQNDPRGFDKWIQNTLQSRMGNRDEAVILYQIYSEYYEILQDRNSAIAMAEKIIAINPDFPEGFVLLGRLYYLENRIDKAKSYLSQAYQLDNNDARTSYYLGLIAERRGDILERERYFEQARKKNDRSMHEVGWRTRYESRPGYYLYAGYLDLIEQAYRDKIKLNNDVNNNNSFAYFLALENRKLNEALRLINDALEEMPNDVDLLDTKAVTLYQLGEYTKSHEILLQYENTIEERDLERDPTYSCYLGKIKWAIGDTVSAKNYFKYAMKKTNPNAMDKRAQNEIKNIMAEHN